LHSPTTLNILTAIRRSLCPVTIFILFFQANLIIHIILIEDYILVFTKNNGSRKYDIDGNYRLANKECPTPPGYYDINPINTVLVLNTSTLLLVEINGIEYDKNIHIKISVPNGDRIKLFRTDINKNIYYNKKLITKYGLPNNCIYHQFLHIFLLP
jgi:hypothetical protein